MVPKAKFWHNTQDAEPRRKERRIVTALPFFPPLARSPSRRIACHGHRPAPPREIGGPSGPEPTRYGDWEKKGRCIDF